MSKCKKKNNIQTPLKKGETSAVQIVFMCILSHIRILLLLFLTFALHQSGTKR